MRPRTLADFVGECRGNNNELNFRHCPVCGSDKWKLYVNITTGSWYCFASGHSQGGKVTVAHSVEQIRSRIAEMRGTHDQQQCWPEVMLPPHRKLSAYPSNYMDRRGVTADQRDMLLMSEMVDAPYVLIPYFDQYGIVIYWTARLYHPTSTSPKYLSAPATKPPYMPGGLRQTEQAVLVEGPLDAIHVYMCTGIPTIAIGGTTLSHAMEKTIRQLVSKKLDIMLDGDATAKALKLGHSLMDAFTVMVHRLHVDDDPAELSSDQLREMLHA